MSGNGHKASQDGRIRPSGDGRDVDVVATVKGSYGDTPPAVLVWDTLVVKAMDQKGNERILLDNISGFVEPSQMLAIMGPSGCGKTTLLNTLSGRNPSALKQSGRILVNGHESHLSYGKSAYVTQEDMLVGTLTVRETLMFTAKLRLPASMSHADKEARVDEMIRELGLTKVQHAKIGNALTKGIASGQKRRVAIGCELVTHPTLLFLDEPTTGLDAAAAYQIIKRVRHLSEAGRTIITVIHQPSSEVFELFDQLYLLASGKLLYFGEARQALSMFEVAGLPCPDLRAPTDHFLHVINKDFTTGDVEADAQTDRNAVRLEEVYKKTLEGPMLQKVASLSKPGAPYKSPPNEAGWLSQVVTLTHRFALNNIRNIGVFWVRLAMYISMALVIGTVFYDLDNSWSGTYGRIMVIFYTVCFLTFMSISGFPAFAEDMEVFVRERLNGYYHPSVFTIANTIASVPFIWLISILCTLVIYWLSMMNDEGDRVPYFFINLACSMMVVESMVMMLSALLPHYLMGIAVGAAMLGMHMMLAGGTLPVSDIPRPFWYYPMHFLGFHSFAFGGFVQNEFEGTDGWQCDCAETPAGCSDPNCTLTGQDLIDYWVQGAGRLNKWGTIGVQLGMALFYRTGFFMTLIFKEKLRSGKIALPEWLSLNI